MRTLWCICAAVLAIGMLVAIDACVSDPGDTVVALDGAAESAAAGDFGGPCFPNDSCNGTLVCISGYCVTGDSGTSALVDAGASDARSALDSALESGDAADAAPSCVPRTAPEAGVVAPFASVAPTIDGDLKEWGTCASFYRVDTASGTGAGILTGISELIQARWTADGLYFAIKMTDPSVGGTNNTSPYLNDAVEVYLGPDTNQTAGTYKIGDVQFVVDVNNFAMQYNGSGGTTPISGFKSAAALVSGGYVVEMFVPSRAFGYDAGALSARTIAFDTQVDNWNAGKSQAGILYYQGGVMIAGCPAGCLTPSCNTCVFSSMVLMP
jgi:hypothetical protein